MARAPAAALAPRSWRGPRRLPRVAAVAALAATGAALDVAPGPAEPGAPDAEAAAEELDVGTVVLRRVRRPVPVPSFGGGAIALAPELESFRLFELPARSVEPLDNIANVQYLGDVDVGTPGKRFSVIFDTGSSDFWVDAQKLPSHFSSTMHTPPPFSGFSKIVRIFYSIGYVSGRVYFDRMCIAGRELFDQTVVLAGSIKGLDHRFFDGVLGLAFPPLSHTRSTVLEGLRRANVGVFSFRLGFTGEHSYFALGMPKNSWLKPGHDIMFAPVVVREWWTLSGSVAVGGNWLVEDSYLALDTGTSYISVPPPYYEALLKTLMTPSALRNCSAHRVTKEFICPCRNKVHSKILYISIFPQCRRGDCVGSDLPIFPEDLFTPAGWSSEGEEQCVLEIQPGREALPLILGDTFLRTVVAVFDAEGYRIGIAGRGREPRLESTKRRLERDMARSSRAPAILPPHRPQIGEESTPSLWAIFAAMALGAALGMAFASLVGCLRPAATRACRAGSPGQDPECESASYARM